MDLFTLTTRYIDITDGHHNTVLLNARDATNHGILATDKVTLVYNDHEIVADVDITYRLVKPGEIGLFDDLIQKHTIPDKTPVGVYYTQRSNESVQAIRKKLLGQKLTEDEVKAIIYDMAAGKLDDILTTYYAATSFFYQSVNDELVRATKYSAQTGDTIDRGTDEPIAVKYCIGGVPGNETSMIIVPLLASLGVTIPKTFSTAITSPAATGECVAVLMDSKFEVDHIKDLTIAHKWCLALWSSLSLAPANDRIIDVSHPLAMEPYAKMIVSIMAKQYAMGVNKLLIDVPVGPTAKVTDMKTARRIKKHFQYIGKKLGMTTVVELTDADQPIGMGIGAVLQVREVLRVLQQTANRPKDLEAKAIKLASKLLKITQWISLSLARKQVKQALQSGQGRKKMQELMTVQGQSTSLIKSPNVTPDEIPLGTHQHTLIADKPIKLNTIDLRYLNTIARTLGCPAQPQAGVQLHYKLGTKVSKGQPLITLYATDAYKLQRAIDMLTTKNIY